MPTAGLILSLDLATHTGFALGCPGDVPVSGAVALKRPNEDRSVAFGNLVAWLHERFTVDPPALVVKEQPLALQAFAKLGNSEALVRLTYGLHAVTEALCQRFGIRCEEVSDATVRRHFIGKGRLGSRTETKGAVIQRCRLLNLVPADCQDDNRCDALAVHDWACAHLARRAPAELHLFNERVRA